MLTLSQAGTHATEPQVALDTRGNAVFVWRRQFPTVGSECGDGCFRIQSRSLSRANVLGPLETLSPPSGAAAPPVVAADPNGGLDQNATDGVVAWPQFNETQGTFRIHGRAQIAP